MKCWLCFVHLNLNSLPEKVALFGVDWRDRPNCVNCSPTTDVSRWFSMTSCYWRELNVMIRERERESYTEHISWKPGYRLSSTSKSEVIPWDFGNLSFVCLFFFLLYRHKSLQTLQQCWLKAREQLNRRAIHSRKVLTSNPFLDEVLLPVYVNVQKRQAEKGSQQKLYDLRKAVRLTWKRWQPKQRFGEQFNTRT